MVRCVWVILLLFVLLGGCSTAIPRVQSVTTCDSSLLFDRHPGWPTASDMLRAESWPTATLLQRTPETVYYRETIQDVQGLGINAYDYSTRRFEVYREGWITR